MARAWPVNRAKRGLTVASPNRSPSPFPRREEPAARREPPFDPNSWSGALIMMAVFVAVVWAVQLVNAADDYRLDRFGLRPREFDGRIPSRVALADDCHDVARRLRKFGCCRQRLQCADERAEQVAVRTRWKQCAGHAEVAQVAQRDGLRLRRA